jgi:hypothetical protein
MTLKYEYTQPLVKIRLHSYSTSTEKKPQADLSSLWCSTHISGSTKKPMKTIAEKPALPSSCAGSSSQYMSTVEWNNILLHQIQYSTALLLILFLCESESSPEVTSLPLAPHHHIPPWGGGGQSIRSTWFVAF